jgi:hypothetical protein
LNGTSIGKKYPPAVPVVVPSEDIPPTGRNMSGPSNPPSFRRVTKAVPPAAVKSGSMFAYPPIRRTILPLNGVVTVPVVALPGMMFAAAVRAGRCSFYH